MKVIYGDITDIKKGVIIHQVNNKRVMGAGVAKAIRDKYPEHYEDYICSSMRLGNIVCTAVSDDLCIVGFISQNGWGRVPHVIYTDYIAFEECLWTLKEIHEECPEVECYMPYGIGCGLANGNWNTISKMIEEICPFITLVKYNK